MKQITLRGIPEKVEKKIREEAERKGLSLNKAFLSVIEESMGVRPKEKKKKMTLYHDLDHLCGKWTKEEAEGFRRSLDLQRRIDEIQ